MVSCYLVVYEDFGFPQNDVYRRTFVLQRKMWDLKSFRGKSLHLPSNARQVEDQITTLAANVASYRVVTVSGVFRIL